MSSLWLTLGDNMSPFETKLYFGVIHLMKISYVKCFGDKDLESLHVIFCIIRW